MNKKWLLHDAFPSCRLSVPTMVAVDGLLLRLGSRDKMGIVLVQPPSSRVGTLSELAEVVSDLVPETALLIVVAEINIHAWVGSGFHSLFSNYPNA